MSRAEEIITECALLFAANSDDCSRYIKAVCAVFFEPDLFAGPSMNADGVVAELRTSREWRTLNRSHEDAIAEAQAGRFVIAGMTSNELGANHGHLGVVVGDDGEKSGNVTVPICYAGSLNPAARVQRKRISATFGAAVAQRSQISYFSRDPQALPEQRAVSRLVDRLRGINTPTAVRSVAAHAAMGKA